MSALKPMKRAALAEWRRLPQMQQDAIHSSLLLPHADRPHGFDRELRGCLRVGRCIMSTTTDPDGETVLPPLHTITRADLERHADATGLRCLPGCTIQAHALCSACRLAGAIKREAGSS